MQGYGLHLCNIMGVDLSREINSVLTFRRLPMVRVELAIFALQTQMYDA